MATKLIPYLFSIWLFFWSCKNNEKSTPSASENQKIEENSGIIHYPQEKHLRNVRQLTFGGNNAEAYWSFDGTLLTFQSDYRGWGAQCDQIFYFNPDKDNLATKMPTLVSRTRGRTTCSYFLPGDSLILYASTHSMGPDCPPVPDRKVGGKYVWPIYHSYDIYAADLRGNLRMQITNFEGYDAEATVSPRGDKMVYTADRDGDLNLWIMDFATRKHKQITFLPGYDGGAFFSPDGTQLVFRASRPATEAAKKEYFDLLARGLVQPTEMEIFVCDAEDGGNLRQVTKLGKANWAPYFHPSGKKIIFASNHASSRGFQFNLYMINVDGSGLEQITFDPTFDSFPMFSPDGKRLVFASNRNNGGGHDTNLFIADWVD